MIVKKPRWLAKPPADVSGETSARRRIRTRPRSPDLPDAGTHPWRDLSLRDGRVVQTVSGKESDYLATPDIKIVSKKEAQANADGVRASYAFKLNAAPDLFWRHRFEKNLEHLPDGINRSDIRVEFEDDTLLLLCMPSRLEAKYACVKANVARTNADYRREKNQVLKRIQEQASGKGGVHGKADIVQRRFQRLKL